MTRLQIFQDFLTRWPAVSLSKFAADIGVHRNTLNKIVHEKKEPGNITWSKIQAGLEKYGYSPPS